ncbi:MAG: 3'-5' exonuclease [Leptospirales bacterium]
MPAIPTREWALTEEQETILSLADKGGDLVIMALAGTGKTTTVGLVAKSLGRRSKKGLYLAYNAEMKKTAVAKGFPAECSTIHGLAYRQIVGTGPDALFRPSRIFNGSLPGRMISEALGFRGLGFAGRFVSPPGVGALSLATVRNFCYSDSREISLSHVSLGDYGKLLRGTVEKLKKQKVKDLAEGDPQAAASCDNRIAEYFEAGESLRKEILGNAKILWTEMNKSPGEGKLPITHDVYLKRYVEGVSEGKFSLPSVQFVILDEAQDSNSVTIKLLNAFRDNGAQSIVVGDHYQQIYEWRGTENSMKKILESPGVSSATLSQSFRFGEEIATFVNAYMTRYLNEDFRIRGNPTVGSRVGETARPDAIICRTNAGCLEALYREQGSGRRVYVPKGKEIARMIEDIEALRENKRPKTSAFQVFRDYEELEEFSETEEGKQISMLIKMIDKYEGENLQRTLARAGECRVAPGDVTITTGHGSKGLEWNKVSLWEDFPSEENLEKNEEEKRLGYVAMTRPKNVLDPSLWSVFSETAGVGI